MVEKDRFGEKLKEKERAEEDRYFAERDRAALEKLRAQDDQVRESAVREAARGRCPKCGTALTSHTMDQVVIEQCAACRGIWLDEGELKTLSRRESEGWLGRLFRNRVAGTR